MSTPNIVLTVNGVFQPTRRVKEIEIAIQLWHATPTYTTNGEVIDFSTLTNPNYLPRADVYPVSGLIANEDIRTAGGNVDGYHIMLQQNGSNPTMSNYLLIIDTTAGTPMSGSYPAALAGTSLAAEPKLLFRIKQKGWQ